MYGSAQVCTTLGQNPGTAFPVCGTDEFIQGTVPVCGTHTVPVQCGGVGILYEDKNPYWYKFTCFGAGTLGFTITPNNLNDDYDWQLFDITGRNPDDVYTDASLFVACNWSGNTSSQPGYTGITGASAEGNSLINCGGYDYPTFSAMPQLIEGHTYILLISHFSGDSQSGYSLSFKGGTANITDPTQPAVLSARAVCNGYEMIVVLNKKMKCTSAAVNGSDFTINTGAASIISATGIGCNTGFDMDSVLLTLDKPLPPGNYVITAKIGTDNNTLLDNCNRNLAPGSNVNVVVYPVQPTPMDSIAPIACAPNVLQLVFRNRMFCNSIAANGSDFKVTGPYPVTVSGAAGVCTNGLSTIINVTLNMPVVQAGIYKIELVKGTDSNTIIDECGQQTPAGATLNFNAADTVSASFSYRLLYGCTTDTIACTHDGRNGVNQWTWAFQDGITRTAQNASVMYATYGTKQIKLAVTNGVCSDTAAATVVLDNELKAQFTASPNVLCPEDASTYKDTSTGKIISWKWNFGNGQTSNIKTPPAQSYISTGRDNDVPVTLIVRNNHNCFDTAMLPVKVLYNCYIAVPTAFTPNGDNRNDYLYPLNAYKATNLEFKVYNRYGQLIFKTKDWTKKWDGAINGEPQGSGVYVWMLTYTHHDTGQKYSLQGTTVLIR